MLDEFGRSFYDADVLFVAGIYAASEEPIAGVSGANIVDAARRHGHRDADYVEDLDALYERAMTVIEPGDVVITLGAGDIYKVGERILASLRSGEHRGAREHAGSGDVGPPRLGGRPNGESGGNRPEHTDELTRMAPGQVLCDEPMARHTSFGLGGPADLFVEPRDATTFRECADYLSTTGVPVTLLGRGTNILVKSGGIEGAVLTGSKAFGTLSREGDAVRVGGGVGLPRLLTFCAENGLSGLEGLSGIPGSAGGAVVTNAGSFGVSIGDRLTSVTVSRPGRSPSVIPRDELEIGYRQTEIPRGPSSKRSGWLSTPVIRRTSWRRTGDAREEVEGAAQRDESAGCVFKNPPGDAAGRLVDEAGLKGTRVGGAVVSDLHANFILNDRGATVEDVEELIEIVRERVVEAAGVKLELEVEIIGRQ